MSQPDLANPGQPAAASPTPRPQAVPTQKQKTNVYTMMLIISFICIVTACVLLYQEVTRWGDYPWWETNEGKPNVTSQYVPPAGSAVPAVRSFA